jgi:hypothetical protein
MIRDPSDGSVKGITPNANDLNQKTAKVASEGITSPAALKAKHGENWGLKSLDREPRKPKPAPTADELRAHYARHNLGFQPKAEEGQ